MNIGDDWFPKTMLINSFLQNGKLTGQTGGASDFGPLFITVLNQLMQNDFQLPSRPMSNSLSAGTGLSNFFHSTDGPAMTVENSSVNSGKPLRFQTTSAEKLNQLLGGKLTGLGETFVRVGQWFNIDPALLAAVAQHETGNGKSRAANEKNNIAGMMGIHGLKSYSTLEESIMDMARNLSKNYLDKGLTTITEIGSKYAPVGASNDPAGLNNYWVSGVTKNYNRLRL